MPTQDFAHPKIVSRAEWLAARETLLAHEKELTKHQDKISAERRRLPMVKVEKNIFLTVRKESVVFTIYLMGIVNSLFITSCSTLLGMMAAWDAQDL